MQSTVRFLQEIREGIITIPKAPQSSGFYYFTGQIDLLDRLIRTIGEGALGDGTRTVQNGIELLSAEES